MSNHGDYLLIGRRADVRVQWIGENSAAAREGLAAALNPVGAMTAELTELLGSAGPPSTMDLPGAVGQIPGIMRTAVGELLEESAKLLGASVPLAVGIGALGGGTAGIVVAPLVAPLLVAAEVLCVVGTLLPGGDLSPGPIDLVGRALTKHLMKAGIDSSFWEWKPVLLPVAAGLAVTKVVKVACQKHGSASRPETMNLDTYEKRSGVALPQPPRPWDRPDE